MYSRDRWRRFILRTFAHAVRAGIVAYASDAANNELSGVAWASSYMGLLGIELSFCRLILLWLLNFVFLASGGGTSDDFEKLSRGWAENHGARGVAAF